MCKTQPRHLNTSIHIIVQEKYHCLDGRKDGISHCENSAYLKSQTDMVRGKKQQKVRAGKRRSALIYNTSKK